MGSAGIMTEVPLSVIVADDDVDVRSLMAIAVSKSGLELIDELPDGNSAWEAISSFLPDIVVLDVAMPGKSGLDICRLIRADSRLENIRVILLSAAADDSSRQAGYDAGADEYLVKPFSMRDLSAQLTHVATTIKVTSR